MPKLSEKTARTLIDRTRQLIVQLRIQARLARQVGGDIAIAEGNGLAWKQAEEVIEKAEKELYPCARLEDVHVPRIFQLVDAILTRENLFEESVADLGYIKMHARQLLRKEEP